MKTCQENHNHDGINVKIRDFIGTWYVTITIHQCTTIAGDRTPSSTCSLTSTRLPLQHLGSSPLLDWQVPTLQHFGTPIGILLNNGNKSEAHCSKPWHNAYPSQSQQNTWNEEMSTFSFLIVSWMDNLTKLNHANNWQILFTFKIVLL